jgi:hypothetical protein
MASNNLRFILNLNNRILFRKCNTVYLPLQRLNQQRTFINFKKITLNNYTNNGIKLYQKRFETNQTQSPKPTIKSSTTLKSFSKMFILFVSGVFAYYGISMYLNFYDDKADTSEKALKYKPGIIKNVSKKIDRGVENPGGVKITLYQYATCPFCCKVRAYLDYYGYKYDIVEVNSIFRQQLKWTNYKKVPIVAVQIPETCDLKTKEINYDPDFVVSS